MTSSQHSGHSGGSCNNSAGYSPWGPPAQPYSLQENLYNNPIPYPNGPHPNQQGRYQITPPPNQQPPPLPPCYPPHQRSLHSHYPPPSHAHSDYQPYSYQQQNRRCNSRPCGSYDALTSPQNPLPNPEWYQPHPNQIYTCTSDCSDHSLKRHQQPPLPPIPAIHPALQQQIAQQQCQQQNSAIYENDETEQDHMINGYGGGSEQDRQSECCSSREGENDACCSCSESSCLYAEAGEPTHSVQVVRMAQN